MSTTSALNRRNFTETTLLATAALASGVVGTLAVGTPAKRIRTGLIGCGSVSNQYLPQLSRSPFVEVVSLCDLKPEHAKRQAERFKIAHHYPNLEAMLAGEPFDFPVNTTDMQQHEGINRRTLEAGKKDSPQVEGDVWQQGAVLAAECLVTGKELLETPEQALHVLEIITAARESSATGKRVALTSTFKWPIVSRSPGLNKPAKP